MKKTLFFLILILLPIFSAKPLVAAEKIDAFETKITVKKDANVLVEEKIVYDFGEEERHGIYREFPVIYQNQEGKKFKIDFQVLSVENENGATYQYKQSRKGENVRLKIGDPEKYLSGKKTYVISYKMLRVITYFSDHDELFWNVTGNDWQIPILSVSASVIFPEEIITDTKAVCYTGKIGSTEKNCQIKRERTNLLIVSSDQQLFPREGLTFAVSFPKNIVAFVEPKQAGIPTFLKAGILFGATIYYLLAPLVILYLWFKYGRDPKVGRPVTAWYDPPKDKTGRKLSPAEVGTLVDEYVNEKDLVATIVDLAIRGYLKIKQDGKNYHLIKKQKIIDDRALLAHEKELLTALFKDKNIVSTKELKNTFYKKAQRISDKLYKSLVEKGFFPENPKKVRDRFYVLGIISFVTLNFPLGVLAFLFGKIMPRKTLFGAQAKMVALSLKNFLSSQEKSLTFQEKNWHFFEKHLPYAIIFDVAKLWASRFKDISSQPPEWLEGEYKGTFNPIVFTNSLNLSTSTMRSAMTISSNTSSTGFSSGFSSGSSGGGFGGGGGGSW